MGWKALGGSDNKVSTPGVEPGLSRPRRDVLTTRRCGPCLHQLHLVYLWYIDAGRGTRCNKFNLVARLTIGQLRVFFKMS